MKKGRVLCCGDLHGNHKGFIQALERSGFNNEVDTLISLGDVVDGHCDSFEVVEELLKIKNLIAIIGNHDDWFNQWIETGVNPANWGQGQLATGQSYLSKTGKNMLGGFYTPDLDHGGLVPKLKVTDIPNSHIEFFKNQLPYHLDSENRLFVHGGFNRHYPLEEQGDILWWDRDLWSQALSYESMSGNPDGAGGFFKPKFKMHGDYKEVFIGHTSTQFWKSDDFMRAANIYNLDCGGGWFGRVCIMDVNSKEAWYSDYSKDNYPEFKGR